MASGAALDPWSTWSSSSFPRPWGRDVLPLLPQNPELDVPVIDPGAFYKSTCSPTPRWGLTLK